MKIKTSVAPDYLLSSLFILTLFWGLVEISFFIQAKQVYLESYRILSDQSTIPQQLIVSVLGFIGIQVILHLSIIGISWYLVQGLSYQIDCVRKNRLELGLALWSLTIFAVLLANQYYFPNSIFASLTGYFFTHQIALMMTVRGLFFLLSVAILLASIGWVRWVYQQHFMKGLILVSMIFLSVVCLLKYRHSARVSPKPQQVQTLPNIILIGFDSLRPNELSYFGGDQPAPAITSFLNQGVTFHETLTPLARTFPSWVSLLTGQYPQENGVRTNLPDLQGRFYPQALPAILKKNGYDTVFATDETRFSNLDTGFGFDHFISPPIGLNDFVLGSFNDFPLSNLLVNSALGHWLFPNSYGNRAVFHVYDPDSFLRLTESYLNHPPNKPVLFAIHFCLTHYPYLYSDLAPQTLSIQARYAAAISRVDKQFNTFMNMLTQAGLLNNAMIILLSDHGEALELAGDRITESDLYISKQGSSAPQFYPPTLEGEMTNRSAGHGTDVLGIPQYHSLLAFKRYGNQAWPHHDVSGMSSLIDIKPTILSLLKLPITQASGISLLPYLQGKRNELLANRALFLESDFSPEAIRSLHPDIGQAVLEGARLFKVELSTNKLQVKPEMFSVIMESKQYAVVYGDWILAFYPIQDHADRAYTKILVNSLTGEWTDHMDSSLARRAPMPRLVSLIQNFYGLKEERKIVHS